MEKALKLERWIMKRSEAIAGSPALIASFLVIVGVAATEFGGRIPGRSEGVVVVAEWPAPVDDVPFIDGMTVTAARD